MRILVERSGGFAGIRKRAEVDSRSLPADQCAELEQLVAAAGLHHPAAGAEAPGGPDRFQYKVTVESEAGSSTVSLQDPAEGHARLLLDWVWAHKSD